MNHKTIRIIGGTVFATVSLAACGAHPTHDAVKTPAAQQDAPIHQPTAHECELSAPAIYNFLRDPITQDILAGRVGMTPSRDGKILVAQTPSANLLVSTKDCTLDGLSRAWHVDVTKYMGR